MVLYYEAGNVKYSGEVTVACAKYLDYSTGNVVQESLGAGYSGGVVYLDYSSGNVVRTSIYSIECPL